MKNILVFPCETEEAMELNHALGRLVHCSLFGASSLGGEQKGKFVYRKYLGEINTNVLGWKKELNDLIQQFEIDLIFPSSIEIMTLLAKCQCEINSKIIAPSYNTISFCRSKKLTKSLFKELLTAEESIYDEIVEICCLTDKNGEIRYLECLNLDNINITLVNDLIKRTSQKINSSLNLRGAWSFKLSINNNQISNLKVTPGIIPSMALCRNKGVNLAALCYFDWIGKEIEVLSSKIKITAQTYKHKRYIVHYEYDEVYLDLDDTIILNGKINPQIMTFLFQSRNDGKKVHLITKHKNELQTTLSTYRIQNLFDSVIWIQHSDEKYRYIRGERAIFVDDAFSERKKVAEHLGIPTFELSAVECLIDWRL
ncbi:hypothetical protein [Cohnella massiliensis]|uniref:hypothetical protein n=1 Tax=Cohnella massiliensis TaxID=1816691 RepID=UPI00111A2244|nr:hypothetical protein [Cohnella massiliensis]